MEKPWYPQQNNADAIPALLKTFIGTVQFPISRLTIEKDVKEYPGYPVLSFKDLAKIIEKWGLKTVLYNSDMKGLREMPSPSVVFIKEKELGEEKGVFVMFNGLKHFLVEYLHPRKGWVLEHESEFEKKWAKVALSLIDAVGEGEEDYEAKEEEYVKQKVSNPDLKHIKIMDDFLTDEECDYIIGVSKSKFQPSKIMTDKDSVGDGRTSFSAELHIFPKDEILNNIRARAAKLIDMPESHFEYFQCLYYDPGQEYMNHYDTFDESTERGRKLVFEKGQRKYTILAYLNDDFSGGATHFPNLDLVVQPKKKRIVIFNNLDENGQVLNAAYHAGLPVVTGRKYAVNIWVRNKPCRDEEIS